MAKTPASRNPFAHPDLPTLADLIDRVRTNAELPSKRSEEWRWALKAVARAAGKTPAEVPAHPEFLRKLFERAAPAAVGLSPAAWNNARSLAGKALKWAGVVSMPAHYQAPFSPEWEALDNRLPAGKNALRMQLCRLLHYCSANQITPDRIDDAVMTAFHQALINESIVEGPYEIYRSAAKSWNNAVERVPGWPSERVTIPTRAQTFCVPWSAFPASLAEAVDSYCDRAEGKDLRDDHFTRAQRPATIKTRRWQLQFFATAVVKSGVDPADVIDLRFMLEPEVAERGLLFLIERNNGETGPQISDLACFLPTLARRLEMPDKVVKELRKMARKLKVVRHGLSENNRQALRAFDDEQAVQRLLGLPDRLVAEVLKSGRAGYREAKLIQSAVAIQLLLNAPVRLQNLVSIDTGRHLIEVGNRKDRQVHLRFPAEEVKNSNDLEFPLAAETVDLLEIYRTRWRPLLSAQPSPYLFPGEHRDKPKHKSAVGEQIKETVRAYTGLEMNPHRFRHAAAKIFLDRNPGQYEVIRLLLGHKSVETTIAFYAGAETEAAVRHYAQSILQRRGERGGSAAR